MHSARMGGGKSMSQTRTLLPPPRAKSNGSANSAGPMARGASRCAGTCCSSVGNPHAEGALRQAARRLPGGPVAGWPRLRSGVSRVGAPWALTDARGAVDGRWQTPDASLVCGLNSPACDAFEVPSAHRRHPARERAIGHAAAEDDLDDR